MSTVKKEEFKELKIVEDVDKDVDKTKNTNFYNEGQEYNVSYVTKDGKQQTKKVTPEKDMSKPQMIMKLKEEYENFFKLMESKVNKIKENFVELKEED